MLKGFNHTELCNRNGYECQPLKSLKFQPLDIFSPLDSCSHREWIVAEWTICQLGAENGVCVAYTQGNVELTINKHVHRSFLAPVFNDRRRSL